MCIRDRTRYWSWWEQTEAVVGFLNAWEMTGESHFLQISKKILDFTLRHFVDKAGGGWFPRLNAETNCPWPDPVSYTHLPEYCDLFFEDQPGFPNLEGVNGNQQQFSSSVNEIYEDYVGSGRTVTEMNEHWGTIQPLFATKLWVYYLEAVSYTHLDVYKRQM